MYLTAMGTEGELEHEREGELHRDSMELQDPPCLRLTSSSLISYFLLDSERVCGKYLILD